MSNGNTTTYRIELRPTDYFFFGGEQNFGSDEETTNYRVRSRYFPQQTTILGFLRYLLLLAADLFDKAPELGGKISDKNKAAALIGNTSFAPDKLLKDFGIIEQLSPVFLFDQTTQKSYFPAAPIAGMHLQIEQNANAFISNSTRKAARLYFKKDGEPYSYKTWLEEQLIELETDEQPLKLEKYFTSLEKVGIQKSYTGKTANKAFFKQTVYRLKDNFAFAFYCTLHNEYIFRDETGKNPLQESENQLVQLGGERSTFAMTIKKVQNGLPAFQLPSKAFPSDDHSKLLLINDAFVSLDELNQLSDFIIGETQPFRFIKTSINDTNKYYNLSRESQATDVMTRSDRYTLLKRGTVIYTNATHLKALKDLLSGNVGDIFAKRFHKIGYNFFTENPKS